MMLTAVVFQQYVADMVPKLNYLTFLDQYLLGSYFMLISILIEVFLSGRYKVDEDINTRILWFNVAVWTVAHILVIIYAVILYWVEYQKLDMSIQEMNEIAHHQKKKLIKWGAYNDKSGKVEWTSLDDTKPKPCCDDPKVTKVD